MLFSVDWSEECKHLAEVMTELSNQDDLKTVQFIKIGAEDFPEISMKHEVGRGHLVANGFKLIQGSP